MIVVLIHYYCMLKFKFGHGKLLISWKNYSDHKHIQEKEEVSKLSRFRR